MKKEMKSCKLKKMKDFKFDELKMEAEKEKNKLCGLAVSWKYG